MGLFKKGNPITEKQMEILQRVVDSKGSRDEYYEYKPYVVGIQQVNLCLDNYEYIIIRNTISFGP